VLVGELTGFETGLLRLEVVCGMQRDGIIGNNNGKLKY